MLPFRRFFAIVRYTYSESEPADMTEFSDMHSGLTTLAAGFPGATVCKELHHLRSEHPMARKYSKAASEKVEKVMRERKRGTLKSGSSGRKVTSRKQAIAIGLSEARRAGKKVPARRAASKRKSS
jgi:hypothetical protein